MFAPSTSAASSPALLFSNGIGDHVLAMPALRAIAKAFTGRLTLMCSPTAPRFLFDELPLRRIVEVAFFREDGTKHFDARAAVRELGACDLFISLVPWRSASLKSLVTQLSPAPAIGLTRDFPVQVPRDPSQHMADVLFRVARSLLRHARIAEFTAPLPLPAKARAEASALRERVAGSKRILAVHADTVPEKTWAPRRLAAVLRQFLGAHPDFCVCVVGTTPMPELLDRRIVPCLGLPVATSFALVAQADLFLGVDSCMLHVADLCRVPSVALFGPTRAETWGLRFGSGVTIQAKGSMSSIGVGAVARALERVHVDSRCCELWEIAEDGRLLMPPERHRGTLLGRLVARM